MRIALISDIHANAVALRAVLTQIRQERVDRVVCLGDVATLGPAPHAVLELLADLECPCIRGNHDDFLLDPKAIESYTDAPPVVAAVAACRETLSPHELAFVATFSEELSIELDGDTLSLFHGSPRSNTEDLLATTPSAELDCALGDDRPTLMAGGHTHLQLLRQHRGTLLINPGSVGLPFEAYAAGGPPKILPHAEYAIVDSVRGSVSVSLRRLPLECSRLLNALDGWDNPLAGYLRQQYGG